MAEVEATVFKKRSRSGANAISRKTGLQDDRNENKLNSEVVRTTKRIDTGPLAQSSGRARKRVRTEEVVEDEDYGAGDNGVGVAYSSSRNVVERRSPSPSNRGPKEGDIITPDVADDGLYHGAANYKSQLPKGGSRFGPVKGPDNIRTITLTDYQPDVCKDYKETGFCGFGDTCKFLHDRGDYLHGWQLDNMYLSNQPTATKEESEEEEELPFACLICRQPFKEPVVTRCGHYFDQACALKRYAKNSKCAACGASTQGIFNRAEKILARKEKAQKERRKAAGEDTDESEDGLEGIEGLDERSVDED